jgi:hypothetical protein
MPDPIQNLFKDMRDRKMLPLVALLILAIVAVPFLLKSDSEPTVPASAVTSDATAAIDGAEIASPVVLTEVPGIRNYHKRLASLQARNPFKQQLAGGAADKAAAKANKTLAQDTQQAVEDLGASGATATGTASSGSSEDGTTTTPETPTTPEQKQKTYAYYSEIDAKVGLVGEGEKKTGISQLEFLPGDSHPVVQFIRGVGETAAIFVVSRSVGDTSGDGNCQPHPDDCQFLKMKPGESTTFNYEPNGLRYRIKLTDVNLLRKRIDPKNADFSEGDAPADVMSGG